MAKIDLYNGFEEKGVLFSVSINGLEVFYSMFKSSAYKFVITTFTLHPDNIIIGYPQLTRHLKTKSYFEYTDALGTTFRITKNKLFK